MAPTSVAVNATFLLSGMLGLQIQLPDGNGNISVETSFTNDTATNMASMTKNFNMCGSTTCKSHQKCVTWQKNDDSKRANLAKECMVDDGRYSTKTNPLENKLCGPGETHSLIISEPEPCLENDPPCDIVWKYKCVKEEDSPHSCRKRKCPPNFVCLELVHCERYPPCITVTECHHISEASHLQG